MTWEVFSIPTNFPGRHEIFHTWTDWIANSSYPEEQIQLLSQVNAQSVLFSLQEEPRPLNCTLPDQESLEKAYHFFLLSAVRFMKRFQEDRNLDRVDVPALSLSIIRCDSAKEQKIRFCLPMHPIPGKEGEVGYINLSDVRYEEAVISVSSRLYYDSFRFSERDCRIAVSDEEVQRRLQKEADDALAQQRKGGVLYKTDADASRKTEVAYRLFPGLGVLCDTKGDRPSMEDYALLHKWTLSLEEESVELELRALFDGHGGKEMSFFAQCNFAHYVEHYLKTFNPKKLSDLGIWNALKIAVVALNRQAVSRGLFDDGGSTLNATLRIGSDLWCVNVGDSRAVLVDVTDNETLQLSEDAHPEEPKYRRSVNKRRGNVQQDPEGTWRVQGRIAPGRALGDFLVAGMTARPKITRCHLKDGHLYLLVHACDGLWDVVSTQEVKEKLLAGFSQAPLTCLEQSLTSASADLVKLAYKLGSEDNISVLLALLDNRVAPSSPKDENE